MRRIVGILLLGMSVGLTNVAAADDEIKDEINLDELDQMFGLDEDTSKEVTGTSATEAQCEFTKEEKKISCELGGANKAKLLAYKASGFGEEGLLPNVMARELEKASAHMKTFVAYDQVAFKVTPLKTKAIQDDYCVERANSTEENPLSFTSLEFKNTDEINEWVMDLALSDQVNKDFCPKTCSPYYKGTIKTSGSGLALDLNVYCGLERDMSAEANYFNISTSIRKSE